MNLSPFQILGVPEDADDGRIRAAYLQKVRQHPPERDPETFRLVRQAYEAIKDVRARIDYALFHVADRQAAPDPVSGTPPRPTLAQFQAMLRHCAERMNENGE